MSLRCVAAEEAETRRLMGPDFWPCGIESNRVSIEAVPQYLYEQHLAPRKASAEELFAPVGATVRL